MRFTWPEGKRAALSITFDDTRSSQIDQGLPILDAHGVRATFYAYVPNLEPRLDDWRRAAAAGHEIGNHTLTHPCSGNFHFVRDNPLEEYTLARMEGELTEANAVLERLLGRRPATFAFPCGQKFVGRGQDLQSYIPLVARHFLAGRGFRDESANDPAFCDPAQLFGMDADDVPFARLRGWIDRTIEQGHWLILAAHDVGAFPAQAVAAPILDELCRYATDPANGLWVNTVAAVAAWVRRAHAEDAAAGP